MNREKNEKTVMGGVLILISFAVYVFGIVHTANYYSRNKAFTAFLIPPYGFYMGVKGIFGVKPEAQFPPTNIDGENQSTIAGSTDHFEKTYHEDELNRQLTHREIMERAIEKMNEGLPRTDGLYRLNKVEVVNDYTYGYHGTLLNIPTYTNEFENYPLELKQLAVNNVCSDAQGQIAAKSGSHAIYYNYALDGSFLFSVEVTPKDCGY
ncbi:hypothetical protein OHW74_18500 [Acinetobacter baumannii]|nr:hypothetical protein [Acinetobacter baumannii]